jgi:hypothetical protein
MGRAVSQVIGHALPEPSGHDPSSQAKAPGLTDERNLIMKISTVSNLALAAAFAGLMGGTAIRANAQPLAGPTSVSSVSPTIAGVMAEDGSKTLPKHACKGQNSCKGQGACATDGSKH